MIRAPLVRLDQSEVLAHRTRWLPGPASLWHDFETVAETVMVSSSVRIVLVGALFALLASTGTACSRSDSASTPSRTASTSSRSQLRARSGQIQTVMDSLTKTGYFPGIVTLIREHGRQVTLTSGLARRHPRQPMAANDRFAMGSVTKMMVAAAVFQLVDEHRLRLSATVESLLPGLLPSGEHITVAELLSHRSGLPDPVNDPRYQNRLPANRHATPRQVVDAVSRAPLDFRPGSSAEYSNTNFEVLGLIIEHLTKQTLGQALHRRIFGPLAMRTASLHRNDLPDAPLAHGYFLNEDVTNRPIYGEAAGAAVMDAPDVERFLVALFDGNLVRRPSLVHMEARQEEQLGMFAGYGYGLAQRDTNCGRAFGHSGRVNGYVSEAWVNPSRDTSVVVLANRDENSDSGGTLQPFVETALCGD